MKFKILTPESKSDTDTDQLYMRLQECPNHGDIHLIVCDKDGKKHEYGNILSYDIDMKCLVLYGHPSTDLPIRTSIEGHILTITTNQLKDLAERESKARIIEIMENQIKDHIDNSPKPITH